MNPILKKILWGLAIAAIPVSLLIALGFAPGWKPFLSDEASLGLVLVLLAGLVWSSFRPNKRSPRHRSKRS